MERKILFIKLTFQQRLNCRAIYYVVRLPGIEPGSTVPQTAILSIKLWAQSTLYWGDYIVFIAFFLALEFQVAIFLQTIWSTCRQNLEQSQSEVSWSVQFP